MRAWLASSAARRSSAASRAMTSTDCSGSVTGSPSSKVTRGCPRPLDQDLPHRVRRDGAEVRPVLPALGPILQQLQIRFVHQRRRLQRLARALTFEIVRGEPAQLGVDHRHQRLERRLVAPRGAIDELVDRRRVGHQARSMVTLFITTGVTGRSCRPVGTAPIFLTTSSPSTTSPNTECRLSRCGVGPSVMKNWLPLVLGPALAIDRMPALSWRAFGWNSSAKLKPGPPVPCPSGSPPWI